MKKIFKKRLILWLDDIKIKHKLYLLYIVCFLIPLLLTDTLIGYNIFSHEKTLHNLEKEKISDTVINTINSEINAAASFQISIYKNSFINNFLKTNYETPLDYLISFQDLNNRTLFTSNTNLNIFNFSIYTENDSVINGGIIQKKEKAKKFPWYNEFLKSSNSPFLFFDFDTHVPSSSQRRFLLIRNMDYYKKNDSTNFLKVEINYSDLYQKILDINSPFPLYVVYNGCEILSNTPESSLAQSYNPFKYPEGDSICKLFNIYGKNLSLYIIDHPVTFKEVLRNYYYVFIVLFLINILLPLLFLIMLNNSFARRINALTDVIQDSSLSNLKKIENPRGKDEIGILFIRYNEMVERIENLIQTVYENKIKEKNMIVARQKAELLALHSQINPHFLFNILESIRMHSVIKKESETAEMIQRLAVIQRQYADWERDNVSIKDELDCVKAYLDLQKYRFGERLNYNIEVDSENTGLLIPKLSIVTFVENACVHGIEGKSTCCWIFVRIQIKNNYIEIEIEDTGKGMNQQQLSEIRNRIDNASIELLQKEGHIGIINACLRLKIFSEEKVRFNVESEEFEGTTFTIQIPLNSTINQFLE